LARACRVRAVGEAEGPDKAEEWFAHQLRAFRQIAPARRASLRELLGSDHPSVETLGGSRHYFRRADLEAASSKLPGELWDARVFPLIFVHEAGSEIYLLRSREEALAFKSLLGLEGLQRTDRGEFYTYRSLVLSFIAKYPSLGLVTP
jgi:uncharacterized protein (UPF0216 family)